MKHIVKYIFAILFMALLMIIDKNIVNASTFNFYVNGTATGYLYQDRPINSTPIYKTWLYTDTDNQSYTFTYNFKYRESVSNQYYPLSFVEIHAQDQNSQNALCSVDGCNIAYSIPISLQFECDMETYCGFKDNLTSHGGNIILNTGMVKVTDLPDYFEDYPSLVMLYNFLTNDNSISVLYKNQDNRLKQVYSYFDVDKLYFTINSNAYRTWLTLYTFNGVDTYDSANNLIYGRVLDNDYYTFDSIRLFFNYPYSSNLVNYEYSFKISFSNFNVNTEIGGVIPVFPEEPSIPIEDLLSNSDFNSGDINAFLEDLRNMFTYNEVVQEFYMLLPNFYRDIIYTLNNGSCSSIDLGSLLGTHLIMPCIDLGSLLGSTLWGIIDILLTGTLCFSIRKLLFKVFRQFIWLKGDGPLD